MTRALSGLRANSGIEAPFQGVAKFENGGRTQVVLRNITAVALFFGCLAAFGQDAATLTVTVVDPSAAVVPGAKITLTEQQRGIVTKGETNESGFLIFNLLQPG